MHGTNQSTLEEGRTSVGQAVGLPYLWIRDADNSGILMPQRRGQASPGDRCGEGHTCPSVSFASEKRSELSWKLLSEYLDIFSHRAHSQLFLGTL